jgi:hypothetical protein
MELSTHDVNINTNQGQTPLRKFYFLSNAPREDETAFKITDVPKWTVFREATIK